MDNIMNTETRFHMFETRYNDAISYIKTLQTDDVMSSITNWLLDTEINPYSFLPESYAALVCTAEGFESLLHEIRHALFDDGDISFPVINNNPYILFVDRYEATINSFADLSLYVEDIYDINDVVWLNSIEEFMAAADEYHKKTIKKCFNSDLRRFGIDEAVSHYKNYKVFDESWIPTK
jgi:hypothetical protein